METKLLDHIEPMRNEVVSSVEGPQVERLNYGVSCKGVNYRTLKSRNQLIKNVVNPLIDMIMQSVERDGGEKEGRNQRFTVNIVVTAECDIDTVQ
jgi:hypothetical protein